MLSSIARGWPTGRSILFTITLAACGGDTDTTPRDMGADADTAPRDMGADANTTPRDMGADADTGAEDTGPADAGAITEVDTGVDLGEVSDTGVTTLDSAVVHTPCTMPVPTQARDDSEWLVVEENSGLFYQGGILIERTQGIVLLGDLASWQALPVDSVAVGTIELRAPFIYVAGVIYANGMGYRGQTSVNGGPEQGAGPGGGLQFLAPGGGRDYLFGGGGGHGAAGQPVSTDLTGVSRGPANGAADGHVVQLGSAGGPGEFGVAGNGGGAIVLVGEQVCLRGQLQANGTAGSETLSGPGGGGSGGMVLVRAGILEVWPTGVIQAAGGGPIRSYAASYSGSGAGGRIRAFYRERGDIMGLFSVPGGLTNSANQTVVDGTVVSCADADDNGICD